ncbi:MAG: TonB-dependent receptor, partial [Bacteroidota bacterium]|nr:TonB-dependent receptor [Bacteroidota bacterium]
MNFPIFLKLREHELKIITVNELDNVSLLRSNPLKKYRINKNDFSAKSFLAGESDVIKSLASVPGVSLYGEGSVMFNLRGGDKGQNAILIDDAPVYNPSHLLGFFSTIAPEAINSMTIYKSNFPISQGGRLSSYVDIRTKDGDMSKLGFGGIFSPVLCTFTLDGPIKKDKCSFYTTFRKSNINYLFPENNLDILFYDFHFKINYKPSRKNRFFFAIYRGFDNIQFQNSAIRWRNNTMTFRWNHLFSDKLFSNTTVYSSLYQYFFYYSLQDNVFWNSDISNFSIKQDYTYYKNSFHKLYIGFETKIHSFNPGNLTLGNYYLHKVYAGNVWSNNVYFGGEYKPSDKISVNYGLRFTNWNNYGPTKVYSFDSEHRIKDTLNFGTSIFNSYNKFSPRISLHYLINSTSTISLAYDQNVQFLHYLTNSISPFTTIDFWIPANMFIEPQTANQLTLGFLKKFTEIDFSIELFAKKMNNQVDYANQPNLFLNPFFESQLRFGKSYSAGIEVSLQKQKGDFKFTISYAYSRTIRTTPDVNFNNPYSAIWDKPHNLYFNLSYNFSDRFSINTSFVYLSGNR